LSCSVQNICVVCLQTTNWLKTIQHSIHWNFVLLQQINGCLNFDFKHHFLSRLQ